MIRTASILATDLVDSTGLRIDLGEEFANRLTIELESLTASVIHRHDGDVVKHLGDGSLASFVAAGTAMDAAVAMQQAVARLDGRWPDVDVALRVGVSTGDVDVVADDVYGRAVVEAVRLCGLADGGEILVSARTSGVADHRDDGDLEQREPVDLKGLPGTVDHSALRWSVPEVVRVLPSALTRAAGDVFVGRDQPLAELAQLVDAPHRPAVGFVRAEAGMGKSALLAHLGRRVVSDGGIVLYGAAADAGGEALQPWPAALESSTAGGDDVRLLDALGTDAPLVGRLVPHLAERLRLPQVSRTQGDNLDVMARAVARFLGRLSEDQPVLVALDDLHWASGEALELAQVVIDASVDTDVAVVLSWRGTDVDDDHPVVRLQRTIARTAATRTVDLAGLDEGSVALLASGVDPAVAEVLRTRSGGNPFFVRELVRSGAARAGADAGGSLEDLIRQRLAALGDHTVSVLVAAALIGNDFDVEVLEVVMGEDVLAAVERAATAGLLRSDDERPDRMSFVHGLVPDVLTADVSGPRRVRLHVRIADALEELGRSDPSAMTHHLLSAGTTAVFPRLCHHARRAAANAVESFAHDEAATILRNVVSLGEELGLDSSHAVAAVLCDLAEVRYGDGDVDERRELGLRVLSITEDPDLSARAAVSVAGFPQAGRPRPEAERALRLALSRLPEDRLDDRAELLSVLAYYKAINEGEGEQADLLACEAVELGRRSGSPPHLAEALSSRSFVLTALPPVEEHRRTLEELERTIERIPEGRDRWPFEEFLLRQRGPIRLRVGDREGFEDDLAALDECAVAHAAWIPAATVAMWRGLLAHAEGRFAEAEAHLERMLELGAGEANFVNSYAAGLFAVRRSQGRLSELRDLAETTVEANPALVAFLPALAVVRLDDGDEEGAVEVYRRLASDGFEAVPQDVTTGLSLPNLVELCRHLGDADGASLLLRRLDPFAGQMLVAAWGIYVAGAVDRYRAMLSHVIGNADRAQVLARRARHAEDSLGFSELVRDTDDVVRAVGSHRGRPAGAVGS